MRIQVIPSNLRGLALQWQQAARELGDVLSRAQRAWSSLDWEIRRGAALEAQVIQAQRMALALQEETERLARFLQERATAFEEADSEGVGRLTQATAS